MSNGASVPASAIETSCVNGAAARSVAVSGVSFGGGAAAAGAAPRSTAAATAASMVRGRGETRRGWGTAGLLPWERW